MTDVTNPHPIQQYLQKNGQTYGQFAKALGTTANTIWYIVKENRMPRYQLAKMIEKYTGGDVTVSGLMEASVNHRQSTSKVESNSITVSENSHNGNTCPDAGEVVA